MNIGRFILNVGCVLAFGSGELQALEVCSIFSDHAVLQRNKPIPVWGWAAPGSEVVVTLGDETVTTKVGTNSAWRIDFNAREASIQPVALHIKGDDTEITFQDLLIGDVWIAGGQSNMEWPFAWMKNRTNHPDVVHHADYFPKQSNHPAIRYFHSPNAFNNIPQRNLQGNWLVCSDQTIGDFTAVGFWFALEVRKRVDVPIGLVDLNWGGTTIDTWMSPESFQSYPALSNIAADLSKWHLAFPDGKKVQADYLKSQQQWTTAALEALEIGAPIPMAPPVPYQAERNAPTRIWNAMVNPVIPYAVRGLIWYQGEGNSGDKNYYDKMKALIEGWRFAWNDQDIPFYYVQLAAFAGGGPMNSLTGDGWTHVREAQLRALNLPKSGMAVTIDIGQEEDVHPMNKNDVGERLARWALHDVYGFTNIIVSGPIATNAVKDGSMVRISFMYADQGLMTGKKNGLLPTAKDESGMLTWFALAGKDGQWKIAEAIVEGNSVVVSHPEISEPVEVSYAWNAYPAGANLYNQAGLPASPFKMKIQ